MTTPSRSRQRVARFAAAPVVAGLFMLGACGGSSGGGTGGQTLQAYGSVKPSNFVYTGDSTGEFKNVAWKSWGDSIARGTGELWTNDCRPDCATGRTHDEGKADIELSQVSGNRYTLLRITDGPPAFRGQFPINA
jgi:hypothetical protein